METIELKLNIPEDILYTLNETKVDFIKKMKLYTAMELFRLGKLSTGKAAELAEIDFVDFVFYLGKNNIALINYEEDDFKEEIKEILKQ